MIVTARTEYACLAMLELAAHHESGQPTRIRTIAELHGIPPRFLVQIMLQLKTAGLVSSTRGAAGGYRLARDPSRISLADILEAMDGLASGANSSPGRPAATSQVLAQTWERLRSRQRRLLKAITLDKLERRVRQQAAGMYYI